MALNDEGRAPTSIVPRVFMAETRYSYRSEFAGSNSIDFELVQIGKTNAIWVRDPVEHTHSLIHNSKNYPLIFLGNLFGLVVYNVSLLSLSCKRITGRVGEGVTAFVVGHSLCYRAAIASTTTSKCNLNLSVDQGVRTFLIRSRKGPSINCSVIFELKGSRLCTKDWVGVLTLKSFWRQYTAAWTPNTSQNDDQNLSQLKHPCIVTQWLMKKQLRCPNLQVHLQL